MGTSDDCFFDPESLYISKIIKRMFIRKIVSIVPRRTQGI